MATHLRVAENDAATDKGSESVFWTKLFLRMFETVQLRHFATKYDRLQQFFGLTTKYGQTRQNTTLLQQRPPLATVVEGSKDRVVEHKGLFYRCVDFVADLPRHQQVRLFNRLVNLFYIC